MTEKFLVSQQISDDFQLLASHLMGVEQNPNGKVRSRKNEKSDQSNNSVQEMIDRWFGFHISEDSLTRKSILNHSTFDLSQNNRILLAPQESPKGIDNLRIVEFECQNRSRGSRGFNIIYGFHPTRFGEALIACAGGGICAVFFTTSQGRAEGLHDLHNRWPEATYNESATATTPYLNHLLQVYDEFKTDPLKIILMGTDFQLQVWRALLQIPFGEVINYENLANYLGRPQSTRAVASAVGKNPISLLIPCHRVLRKDKGLGGYRWGVERKITILAWEYGQKLRK